MLVTRDILDIRNYLNVERVRDFIDVEVSGAFDEPLIEKQPTAAAALVASGNASQTEKASAVTGVIAAAAPAPATSAALPPKSSSPAGKMPLDAHSAIHSGLPNRPRTPHTPTAERKLSTGPMVTSASTAPVSAAAQPAPAQATDSATKAIGKSAAAEEQKPTAAESTASIIENARKRFVEHIEGKPGKQQLAAFQVDATVSSFCDRSLE